MNAPRSNRLDRAKTVLTVEAEAILGLIPRLGPAFERFWQQDFGLALGPAAFHMSLLSACAMPLLLNFCSLLHDHSDRYRRLFLRTHAGDRDVPGEHTRIAELTMARKVDQACALLRQHIARTGVNVRRALTSEPGAAASPSPKPKKPQGRSGRPGSSRTTDRR